MTIEIRRFEALPLSLTPDAHALYVKLFTPINALAAQRHLMTPPEFYGVANDERISKYLAYAGDELVGMSTLLNDLTAWPLLSPEFFRRRFPDEYAAGEIWYVGFVCADLAGVFRQLVTDM